MTCGYRPLRPPKTCLREILRASATALLLSVALHGCSSRPPALPPPIATPTPIPALRLPPRGSPVADFERVAGLRVSSPDGAQVTLHKNSLDAIWGSHCAEIRLRARQPGRQRVLLTPANPWIAPSLFNVITLWVWDDGPAGLRPDHAILLHARDARGSLHTWSLPYRPQPGWQMLHRRAAEDLPGPLLIEALEWNIPHAEPGSSRILLLESLNLYQEPFARIVPSQFFARPHEYAPPYAPRRENTVTLDFPPAPNAFRPEPPSGRHIRVVRRLPSDLHSFMSESDRGTIEYRVEATPGAPSVSVWVNGVEWPQVWSGFSVRSEADPPELRFARLENERLTLQYSQGLRYEISLHGKTLQIECASLAETIVSADLGVLGGGAEQETQPLFLPFLRLSPTERWPIVRLQRGGSDLLVSCFPDWWYSLAGRHVSLPPGPDRGEPLGRMEYPPRWRGARNVFRERIYLTVSDRLQEVIPSAAAPVALHREQLATQLWQNGTLGYPPQTGRAIEPLRILPSDPEWADDRVARRENGDWIPHPASGFVFKPALLMSSQFSRADALSRLPSRGFLHAGASAILPPWAFTDFDSRLPGAGTFTQTWAELGAFYQQVAAETNTPLLSDGGGEWLNAGFFTGLIPSFPLGLGELHPFLPQMAWRNLHPYSAILGLGETDSFRLPGDPPNPPEDMLLHRLIATQLAYAACGRIPAIRNPDLRDFAAPLLAELNRLIAPRRCERIAYWNGQGFVDAAEALRQDVLHRSRLYLRLDDQTEIWINGDPIEDWEVRVDDIRPILPPFGFILRSPQCLVLHARARNQPRIAAIAAPDRLWLHSPESAVNFQGVILRGTAWVHRASRERPARIVSSHWTGEIRVTPERLGLRSISRAVAEDLFGAEIQGLHVSREETHWIFRLQGPVQTIHVQGEAAVR